MFEKLEKYLDQVPDMYGVPGCDLIVMRKHEIIFRHMAGYRDAGKQEAVSDHDLYAVWSMSKLFTVTAAFQLIEQGKLDPEDPVATYLPEYAQLTVAGTPRQVSGGASFGYASGKEETEAGTPCDEVMRIRHLLTMTAGLDYNMNFPAMNALLKEKKNGVTTRDVAYAFSQKPLSFTPGTHFQYSVCHDVLGAVIEVITGMRFCEYIKKYIADPCGITELFYQPDEQISGRINPLYYIPEGTASLAGYRDDELLLHLPLYDSGGAGMIISTAGCALLTDALANGGVSAAGHRILTENSIQRMRTNCLDEAQMKDFRSMSRFGYGYGYGVRTLVIPEASESPAGEFGWDGACGAYCMMIPEQGISAVYMQSVLKYKEVFLTLHPRLRDLICMELRGAQQ